MNWVYVVSDNQWDFDDESQDQNNQQNQSKGLRAQLERALAENKTLKEQAATLTKQVREAAISSLITAKGLNPKIAKLIPSDVESTTEALDKWFEENSDLFPAAPKGETNNDEPDEDASPEDQELAQQMAAMGNVTGASAMTPQREKDLLAQLRNTDLTQEKLMEMISAAGGGYGSG